MSLNLTTFAAALKQHYTADRIEIHPAVMLGKPVIRGTRIPVELVIRKLSEGATEADLLDAYQSFSYPPSSIENCHLVC